MKVVYYFNKGRNANEKNIVRMIYGEEVTYTSTKPYDMLNSFENGDFLICNSVEDLSDETSSLSDVDEIIKEYTLILNKGVELFFDKSTQCNSLFIKTIVSDKQSFSSVLRKCIQNFKVQKDITLKYRKKHSVTSQQNGTRLGLKKGTKLTTKKSVIMKEKILADSKEFNGLMSDSDLIQKLHINRKTFYKYKKELKGESNN